ncbi:MAG: hypothetical protein MK319_01265 [Pseudomonadales bacterium]|nr:hypothetical protein [Pseudomonadales bacterium]
MESAPNYWVIWSVYLLAAAVFYGIFWQLTRSKTARWGAYVMRGLLAAIILTPWYANPQETVLAPALMVVLMDAITLGGAEAVRALVPLSLAIIISLLLAFAALFINTRRENKKFKNNKL